LRDVGSSLATQAAGALGLSVRANVPEKPCRLPGTPLKLWITLKKATPFIDLGARIAFPGWGDPVSAAEACFGGLSLSQNDPTDHALAAIASIFEKPQTGPDGAQQPAAAADRAEEAAQADAQVPDDVNGYTKFGPGPLDALRLRWTARRDHDGYYYVDETIGPGSRPVSSGPMQRDQAIEFVDRRAREARRRFEALRNEMISGPSERGYEDNERDSES
jgi:hypothetical protein